MNKILSKSKLILASPRGFCAGVERAVEILQRAIDLLGAPVYVKHEVVHNKYIIEDFEKKGVIFIEDINSIPDEAVLIYSAHGVSNKIKEIAKKKNIPLLLDGCQFAPHKKVDLKNLDPDFYVFSAHKMYGPSGLGVLYMKDKWIDEFTPYQGGGQMIHDVDIDKSTYANGYEKFEAGTPPIAPVIGFSSSLNFMKEVDPNVIYDYEMKLHDYAYEKLSKFNNIKILGSNKNKGAIISFNIEGIHNSDLGAMLDKKNIAIRTGHHCCQPLMKHFNVTGTSRISFGVYNTKDDVDYLVNSIHEITKILL